MYTLDACEKLINVYLNDFCGQMLQIKDGSLGLGEILLYGAKGKKTIIIKEVYLNEWRSGHKIIKYNKIPAKYQKLIDNN